MSQVSRAIVQVGQHGVVAAVGRQIAITEKIISLSNNIIISSCKPILTIQNKTSSTTTVAISPCSNYALSGEWGGNIKLWAFPQGFCIRLLKGHTDNVNSVAFSPDGQKAISAGSDQTIRFWDLKTGECLKVLSTYNDHINVVKYSPDGKLALSGSDDGVLQLLEVESGTSLNKFGGYLHGIKQLEFLDDCITVLTGNGCSVNIYTGECFNLLEPQSDETDSIFSSDGNYLLSVVGHTLNLTNRSTCEKIKLFDNGDCCINFTLFSHDGQQVLCCSRNLLYLFNCATAKCIHILEGHSDTVTEASFSPDGKFLFSGGDDNILIIWDLITGLPLKTIEGHSYAVSSIVYASDARILQSAGHDTILRTWNFDSGTQTNIDIIEHDPGFKSFSNDGELVVTCCWHTPSLLILDAKTGQRLKTFDGTIYPAGSAKISPDSKKLIFIDRGSINSIDIATGRTDWSERFNLLCGMPSISFSPDGKILLIGHSGFGRKKHFRFSKTVDHHKIIVYLIPYRSAYSSSWSSDGRYVLLGNSDATINLRELGTNSIKVLKGHSKRVNAIHFTNDSRMAVSGSSDCTLRLWSLDTGQCLRVFEGHTEGVSCISLSADNCTIFSGSYDGSIILWSMKTGKELARCYGFDDGNWVVVAPDGRYDSSNNGDCPYLRWTVGMDSFPVSKFKEQYYTAGLLKFVMDGCQGRKPTDNLRSSIETLEKPQMKTVWPEAAMKNMEAAEQTWREQPAMTLKEFMAQSSGSTINEILRPHMTEDLKKRGATHTISARLKTYDEWMSESKHATQNEAPYGQSTMKLSEDEYSAIGQMASKTGGIFGEALLLFRDWAAKQKQLPQGRTARLKMFKEWVEKHYQQYNEDQLIALHFLFRMGKV